MVGAGRHSTDESFVSVGTVLEEARAGVRDEISGVEVLVRSLPGVLVALLAVASVAVVQPEPSVQYPHALDQSDSSSQLKRSKLYTTKVYSLQNEYNVIIISDMLV